MKAVVFHRPKSVKVENVPDPKIRHPRDAILRVSLTAICGSDLHIYNGAIPQLRPMVLGHEFMGVVEEVGAQVKNLKKGDRVVVPFPIACGHCWFCETGWPSQCEASNPKHYGPEGGALTQKGGGLFGYTDLYGGYDGGQAQYVRVPFADYGPRKVPESLTDEQVLFLSDIVPTAYTGLKWADLAQGPVGLQTLKLAKLMGASKVIGVDVQPYRLELAKRVSGAEVINADMADEVDEIRRLTRGHGADVCVDAVGMEVDRKLLKKIANVMHLQRGSITAIERCFSAARRGGRVSILGVYATSYDNFPLGQWFDKGLRVQTGQALPHVYIDELLKLVETGKLRPDDIISHRLPIDQAPHAYDIFNKKEDHCTKVVLDPWA
jgi:threonine dehydrogenase-like Zn-dependent dehydrogenase